MTSDFKMRRFGPVGVICSGRRRWRSNSTLTAGERGVEYGYGRLS